MKLYLMRILISVFMFIILQSLTVLTMYDVTVISIIEFDYLEFFMNCPAKFKIFFGKVSWIDFLPQTKFILATFLNILFTYLFSKNIIEKHLFSKDKIRNFSFYSLGILLFIIIIFSLPRFLLRNFFTMFFFGEVTYISIFLSILWVLPFMSYTLNIVIKYITKQTIKKEDFHFFNENVVNSINIYSICFILVFLYINIHYTGEIFGIILYRIYQTLTFSNSVILCYSDTLPENLVHVFSTEKGEINSSVIKFNGEDKEVHTLSFLKGAVNEKLLDYTNWKTHLTYWGTKPLEIQGKCLAMRQFEETKLVNKPTIESFTFNHSRGFFTSASILDHSLPTRIGVIINIGYEPTISNYAKFWLTIRLEGNDSVLKGIRIMESVFGNRIFPNMDKNRAGYLEVNYPPHNESMSRFGNHSGYKLSDFDIYLAKLSGSLKLPRNMAQVFTESRASVRNNLVNKWNSFLPGDINENSYLRYFHDRKGEMGQLYAKEGKGYLSISSRKLSRSLDSVKCTIDPINLSTAIEDLNKWIPIPALNDLTIDTQVKRIWTKGIPLYCSAPGIVKYSNITNPTYTSDVNIQKFIDRPEDTTPGFLFSNLNNVLKHFAACFANAAEDSDPKTNLFFFDEDIGGRGRSDMLNIFKKDIYQSILYYPKSFPNSREILSSIKYHLGSYTVFEHGEKNSLIILANSNRDLMESIPYSNCIDKFHLLSNIDLRFKDEIWEFLKNPIFKTRGVDGLRYKEAIVVWLDNFSIQMAIFDSIHDDELSYDSQRWSHIMVQDSEKVYKNTFNLWDLHDQKQASDCLSQIREIWTTS
jgi:hypothetical protein